MVPLMRCHYQSTILKGNTETNMGKTAKDIRRMSRDVIGPIPPARCFEQRRQEKYKNYLIDSWYDEEYDGEETDSDSSEEYGEEYEEE